MGDVYCTCEDPLYDVHGDGAQCGFQGQSLHIFREDTAIIVTVRKPRDLHVPIVVQAQSDQSFDATISTNKAFLRIDGTRNLKHRYNSIACSFAL